MVAAEVETVNELRRKVLALLGSDLPREVLVDVLLDVFTRALRRAGGRPSRLEEDTSNTETNVKSDVSPAAVKTSESTHLVSGSGSLSLALLPDPDPSQPIGEISERDEPEPAGFLEFWGLYSKRVGKAEARRAWQRRKPPITKVRATLAWQTRSRQWLAGYVPNPATWINQGRWEDEPPAAGPLMSEREARGAQAVAAFVAAGKDGHGRG